MTLNLTLSTLTGIEIDSPRKVIEQGYIGNASETAGCLIRTTEVYSICNGTILSVNQDPRNSTWTVTVELDAQHWIRYCRLSSADVTAGEVIELSTFIGYGYKHLMRLEYCTSQTSQFPVRELGRQLYKHDPTPIIFQQGRI